jgi:hypothetical protein
MEVHYEEGIKHYNAGEYIKAFHFLSLAASEGHSQALFTTGLMFATGRAVSIDYRIAFRYWLEAAELGNADAMEFIGMAFEKGDMGKIQNPSLAEEWYKKADTARSANEK